MHMQYTCFVYILTFVHHLTQITWQ